jgi:hypothetical protein
MVAAGDGVVSDSANSGATVPAVAAAAAFFEVRRFGAGAGGASGAGSAAAADAATAGTSVGCAGGADTTGVVFDAAVSEAAPCDAVDVMAACGEAGGFIPSVTLSSTCWKSSDVASFFLRREGTLASL